ncbi:MAG: hypothetical protein GEV10_17465 [Streptosporangiales bacterium]|nr:hypothetical protein [Streptosporangiales bacterium]
MADLTRYSDSADDARVRPDRVSTARTPIWVWVVGIVVCGASLAMLLSMFVIPLVVGGMGGMDH